MGLSSQILFLLESDIESKIRLDNTGVLSYEPDIKGLHYNSLTHVYIHVYQISTEDIQEGDPCIQFSNHKRNKVGYYQEGEQYITKGKIIATTDPTLDLPMIDYPALIKYIDTNPSVDSVSR